MTLFGDHTVSVHPPHLGGFVLSRACYGMTTFGTLVFGIEFVHSCSLVDEVRQFRLWLALMADRSWSVPGS